MPVDHLGEAADPPCGHCDRAFEEVGQRTTDAALAAADRLLVAVA